MGGLLESGWLGIFIFKGVPRAPWEISMSVNQGFGHSLLRKWGVYAFEALVCTAVKVVEICA